jgi:hypothetical protein
MMPTLRRPPALAQALFFSAVALSTALPASAWPERTQLQVSLHYTRTVDWKIRLGPDNHEHTQSTFTLVNDFATLADVLPPGEDETWPLYAMIPSRGVIALDARYTAKTEVKRGPDGQPQLTQHAYGAKTIVEDSLRLHTRHAAPVTLRSLAADFSFETLFQGQSTGLVPGVSANDAVCAVPFSPLRQHPEGGVSCDAQFILLPPAGPRPPERNDLERVVARAYDLTHALSWVTAGIPSEGAPSQNWVGLKITKGHDGLPVLTLEETKKWPDPQGEVIDTLKITIRPAAITITAIEPPAGAGEMEEAAKQKIIADTVRAARSIIGKTQKAGEAYVKILAHLTEKQPDLLESDREWIAGEVVAELINKRIVKDGSDDE